MFFNFLVFKKFFLGWYGYVQGIMCLKGIGYIILFLYVVLQYLGMLESGIEWMVYDKWYVFVS